MKIELEVETPNKILTSEEIDDLLFSINNTVRLRSIGTVANLPAKKIGELDSLDPTIWSIIVDIANVGALSMIIKGIFDVIIEWQKSRSQTMIIKVGEVSLEIPANATQQQVMQLTNQVLALTKLMEKAPKQNSKKRKS